MLEVVSPSSRGEDEKEKPATYAKIGVPEYFRYDPEGRLAPALAGFELCGGPGGEYKQLQEERVAGGVVGVRSKKLGLCLCTRPPGPEPLDGSLCWYDPAAGEFLPTRHELADDNRHLADHKRLAEARAAAAEARVAELTALIEKMQRR